MKDKVFQCTKEYTLSAHEGDAFGAERRSLSCTESMMLSYAEGQCPSCTEGEAFLWQKG